MENLEKLLNQTLRKNESKDSRASNKNSNNSQRVGGGGSISGRPPRQQSSGIATSSKDVAELNIQGSSNR